MSLYIVSLLLHGTNTKEIYLENIDFLWFHNKIKQFTNFFKRSQTANSITVKVQSEQWKQCSNKHKTDDLHFLANRIDRLWQDV